MSIGHRVSILPHKALSNRLVPGIIAVMVFLLTLTAAGVIVLRVSLDNLRSELSGRYTVELPTAKDKPPHDMVDKVIDILSDTPGVLSANVVPAGEIARLLEPWLGRDTSLDGLPVPVLIDLATTPGAKIDAQGLVARLTPIVPGVRIEPTVSSLSDVSTLIGSIDAIALVGLALMLASLSAVVVFATGAALSAHSRIIEIAHLIGARDRLIAREFAWSFLRLGLGGGVAGTLIAAGALGTVGYFAQGIESPFLPPLEMFGQALLPLLAIPLPIALLTMLTAMITVRRALARLV